MFVINFGINHALRMPLEKMSNAELERSIQLITCIINSDKFECNREYFKQRLAELKRKFNDN